MSINFASVNGVKWTTNLSEKDILVELDSTVRFLKSGDYVETETHHKMLFDLIKCGDEKLLYSNNFHGNLNKTIYDICLVQNCNEY